MLPWGRGAVLGGKRFSKVRALDGFSIEILKSLLSLVP